MMSQYSCGIYTDEALGNKSMDDKNKALARKIAENYKVSDEESNLSDLVLIDQNGKKNSFYQLFSGKVVYVAFVDNYSGFNADDSDMLSLKERFKYNSDIKFIKIYLKGIQGNRKGVNQIPSYKLEKSGTAKLIQKQFSSIENYMVVDQKNRVLCINGPKPKDRILVDYVLYRTTKSEQGYLAALHLINGIGKDKFIDKDYSDWYQMHFHERFTGTLSFTITTPKSHRLAIMF